MENSKEPGKKKVSNEELDNVTGGTCYSKGKGVVDPYHGEQRRYAIVSPLNVCNIKYWERRVDGFCMKCNESFRKGATWYCSRRWWENGKEVWRDPQD